MEPYSKCLDIFVIFLTLCGLFGVGTSTHEDVVLNLTIIHTNDIHARFEQVDEYGGPCTDDGMCFGGYARRVTKINEIRESEENVLLLDCGDRFLGNPAWFDTYMGLATSHFMNQIGYDAMALGTYDFVKGLPGVLPFLNNITFPLVLSNVDSSQEPRMHDLYVTDHVVVLTNGERVGIVGYMWELVSNYKDIGDLVITPIIESVQAAVDSLVSRGINKIIALGYSDIVDGVTVARMVRGVDVVVSASNDTFLYTGDQPSAEEIDGPYPIVVNPDYDPSANVLFVTTYQFGKYLGYLNVGFDDAGAVRTFDGNPIFLDDSVAQDPEAQAEVERWKEAVEETEDEVVGESWVRLYGLIDQCGVGECNMGNLIADAMVWEWARNSTADDGWADVTMGMVNVGSFYAEQAAGPISYGDIRTWLIYGDTYDLTDLSGRYIVAGLEHSVALHGTGQDNWAFMHVSGMRIIYDMTKPVGSRVQSVHVLCRDCEIPAYVPLEDDTVYRIVVNSYVAGGGDNQDMVRDNVMNLEKGRLDVEILRDYVKSTSPITVALDNRIIVYDLENPSPFSCYPRNTRKFRKQIDQ